MPTSPSATTPTTTEPKSKSVTRTVMDVVRGRQSAASSVSEEGGKRMYRMADGKMVELPPDMTAEEAAKLESEGNAAQKKLGKGPPPKPVPEVKKKKDEKKEKEKPKEKKSAKKSAGKGAAKKGKALVGKSLTAGKSKVAQYLLMKGAPALARGLARTSQLKSNEQQHDDAGEKLKQTEKAVLPPAVEGQAVSNTGQVENVSAKQPPVPDEQKAKNKLKESMEQNIPQSIEDVDNFKKDKKAQHMGAAVLGVINTDKQGVTSTFGDMQQQPAPAPPAQIPEALPPEEIAPATPPMNLGEGAVASLQKEHTDVSNFTKEADGKLKEEGVTQEQLDMVDSGDLAEANKEKKGMEKKAKTEPAAIQTFAQKETQKVDNDLKKEENAERSKLKNQRKQALGATKQKQQGTKTALEKKREEVSNKINNIYKTAQANVTRKLGELETVAMKRFDEGQAQASKEFEENVKRELDAFKSDRYSGFWGWAKKAKDWLLGMEDLPGVKRIFETNRTAFVTKIDKLVAAITEDNKRVIQECKDELANAKKQIKEYVDKLGPDLKEEGRKAQEDMNSKLAALDETINQKAEELQNKLKDKQQAAIKAIDEKIEKMKEAMSGALSKLGKLLLLAAKKFFTWALEKFGFSLSEIESIINKGAAVLKAIFTGPIKFVKNLVNAAGTGFKNFGKNFLKHLKNAVFEWLTGSLEGLILPDTWDLKGILSIVFQMLGVTYQNIRNHLLKIIPEPVVKTMETTFELVTTLITKGPMAAWEQLKEIAGEMKDAFVDAVKDWIKWKVVEKAIETLLSMFIPGAGIIRAIVGIYDTIVFFIQKAKDIMQMIGSFLGSIAEIAAGNVGAAADALEGGLARGLKLVISFLAKFLRLDGITKKIREVIQNLRAKVDNILGKVAKWIADKAKKLWGGVKAGVKSLIDWAWSKKDFTGQDGKPHKVYVSDKKGKPQLIMESTPTEVTTYLNTTGTAVGAMTDKKQKGEFEKLITSARGINTLMQQDITTLEGTQDKGQQAKLQKSIQVHTDRLTPILSKLTAANAATVNLPALIPPMSNGVKTRGFTAEYLRIGNFRHGTEASEYDGRTLGGWKALQAAGMSGTASGQFIKMHMLPSRLGGDAVDSNLTPALSSINLDFSRNVEMPAWRAAGRDYIWYRSTISYYGGAYPANAYPNFISSEWGHYDKNVQPWVKLKGKTAEHFYSASPAAPVLPVIIDINAAKDKEIADFFNISLEMGRLIVRLRPASGFGGPNDIISLLQAYLASPRRPLPPNAQDYSDKTAKQLFSKGGQITY